MTLGRARWIGVAAAIVAGCAGPGAPPPVAPQVRPAAPAARTRADAIETLHDKPAWMPALGACPADVMPPKHSADEKMPDKCGGDALVGCVDRCAAGEARACLAAAHEVQSKGKPDPVSEGLFLRACALGSPSGCTNRTAGRLVEAGDAIDECAFRSFRASCGADDAWGCTMFAFVGAKRGDPAAVKLGATKACALGPNDEPCLAAIQIATHPAP